MTQPSPTPKLSANEILKENDPSLAGSIASTIADEQADHFSEEDNQFLKFHGIYQQDDRDLRKTGKKYIMMARIRMPGGVLTPAQYLALDAAADRFANGTLRTTSRQAIQFHGILKTGLAQSIKAVNDALLTTLAACGDVVRNVTAPPLPGTGEVGKQVLADARLLSEALLPKSTSYHEIWLEGEKLKLNDEDKKMSPDPLYGKTYLPRKFKIAFAIPPNNEVDILTNCLGFIAIVKDGQVLGYNLAAGGGMGRSHGNQETYPRLADVVAYVQREHVEAAARAVIAIHRDFGDRTNRKHARLKYVLADRGVAWFREELERLLGFKLEDARPFKFTHQSDLFGWRKESDGSWSLGLFIETGRIRDTDERRTKSALRKIAEHYGPQICLTPANNMLLAGIPEEQREGINRILGEHGVAPWQSLSLVRKASMACVALPTCGLALAEAERYLPKLMTQIEQLLEETGLANEEIIIRMTGCPNGCARPYMAEIAFVGRAPNRYQVYLGGNQPGTRLNRLYKDNVKDADLLNELRPLLVRFVAERSAGERFGDWVERSVWEDN